MNSPAWYIKMPPHTSRFILFPSSTFSDIIIAHFPANCKFYLLFSSFFGNLTYIFAVKPHVRAQNFSCRWKSTVHKVRCWDCRKTSFFRQSVFWLCKTRTSESSHAETFSLRMLKKSDICSLFFGICTANSISCALRRGNIRQMKYSTKGKDDAFDVFVTSVNNFKHRHRLVKRYTHGR